jgi:hypothetical protein
MDFGLVLLVGAIAGALYEVVAAARDVAAYDRGGIAPDSAPDTWPMTRGCAAGSHLIAWEHPDVVVSAVAHVIGATSSQP